MVFGLLQAAGRSARIARREQIYCPIGRASQEVRSRFPQAVCCCHGGEVSNGQEKEKMRGTVEKIIKPVSPMEPEKAQITIPEADDLYREVRVENVVTDESGEKAGLKPGAEVDIIVEADSSATMKKP